jgi:hypothetical protein
MIELPAIGGFGGMKKTDTFICMEIPGIFFSSKGMRQENSVQKFI